jgi:hypothetical protein
VRPAGRDRLELLRVADQDHLGPALPAASNNRAMSRVDTIPASSTSWLPAAPVRR